MHTHAQHSVPPPEGKKEKDNNSIVKHLLFNDNLSMRPGPQMSLLKTVMKNENLTIDELCRPIDE